MSEPPTNIDAETNVLGALMVTAGMLRPVLVDSGLRREHFYRERHRLIFAAIQELAAQNKPVDALTVMSQLNSRSKEFGGEKPARDYVSGLASTVGVPGNAAHYARLVVEAAALRAKLAGAAHVSQGVHERDERMIQQGIEEITRDVATDAEPSEAPEVRDELLEYLRSPGDPEVWPLPWGPLNEFIGAGGYLRGEFSLLVGWTNLGKSLVLDQLLSHFHSLGARCHLFTTEMSRLERSMRYASAVTGIPYKRLVRRQCSADELAKVAEAVHDFPFGIRSAEGWTVGRIVQEIAAREIDVAAIDPLNLIRFEGGQSRTAWYDDVLERLKSCAVGANCHIAAVAQLNMTRAKDEAPPPPALRDIRDSGTAQYISTHILSLHREYRKGTPMNAGELRFLKVRNGIPNGVCKVELNPRTLRFDVDEPPPADDLLLDYTNDDEAE
jgi:replicative DNA helicase